MTGRTYFASWIGAATGHLAGLCAVLGKEKVLKLFFSTVFADSWLLFFFVSGFLIVSSIFGFVPFSWHAPTAPVFKLLGFIPTRPNYFRSGIFVGVIGWALYLALGGELDPAFIEGLGK